MSVEEPGLNRDASLGELVSTYIEDSPLRRGLQADNPDSDDDPPALSSTALEALREIGCREAEEAGRDDFFRELWGLSQFWYSSETAGIVAREAVSAAGDFGNIACIACPSLFRQIRAEYPAARVRLFEYDPRFEVLGDFTLYDYKKPLDLAADLHGSFAVVVADPPYLSAECLDKTVQTMRYLGRGGSQGQADFCLLTGSTMRLQAFHLLRLRPVTWRPQHKNKLGNEFLMYTNSQWVADHLQGWDLELDPAGGAGSRRSLIDTTSNARSRRSSIDGVMSGRPSVNGLRRASYTGEANRPTMESIYGSALFRRSVDPALQR